MLCFHRLARTAPDEQTENPSFSVSLCTVSHLLQVLAIEKESIPVPTIHVNTDQMRQLGQTFQNLNNEIGNNIEPQIQNQTSQLESDWQGVSRQRYDQLYNDWRSATQQVVQHGEQIGQHLQQTAQRFEEVDQS